MDAYTFSLILGSAGLITMALSGLGRHGFGGKHPPAAPSHDHGAGHSAPTHGGHAGAPGHPAGGHQVGHASHTNVAPAKDTGGSFNWLALLSPRVLFSFLLGAGATGVVAGAFVPEPFLAGIALLGGYSLERFAVAPMFRFFFRFESEPARTLESSLYDEAQAVTGFDAEGLGLIAVELDGQVVQLLATLGSEDRARGVRVHAGDRVRIEEVESSRNRCTVSYVGPAELPAPSEEDHLT